MRKFCDRLFLKMEAYLLTCVALFLVYCYWKLKPSQNLPPGPPGLPFLGYIPFMNKRQYITFNNLRKKYGDIVSLYIGETLFVVLSSYDVVKEILVKHGNNFSGRAALVSAIPPEFASTKGIIFNVGDAWVESKQTTVGILKTFIRDKTLGETVLMNEVRYFLEEIDRFRGKPTEVKELITRSFSNITWSFLFGKRIDLNDERLKRAMQYVQEHILAVQFAGLEIAFPTILKIPFMQKILTSFGGMATYRRLHKFFNDEITKAAATIDDETNNFCFISEWCRKYSKTNHKYDYYRNQLVAVVIDLHIAMSETTSTFLQWALMYMMKYPKVQQKIQKEIDEIIGRENSPTMLHQKEMPYTEATIMEIHRIVSIGPQSLPRIQAATIVYGYNIPKDTIAIANLWGIHHDPKIFSNPDEFQPERFLENGRLKKIPELIPFGVGKRQCVGEALGRIKSFLYLTSILQRFTLMTPNGVELNFDPDRANTNMNLPYSQKICALPRY